MNSVPHISPLSNLTSTSTCKILFLVFHGFSEHNGISKKIMYQREALIANGVDVHFCYQEYDEATGSHSVCVNGRMIDHFGSGFFAKMRKRFCFSAIERYIKQESITSVYMRSNHNANPYTIRFVRRLKQKGIHLLMEIPTFPYDSEYKGVGLQMKCEYYVDRLFRSCFARSIDRIVTFSDDKEIFQTPTICISNGIDFEAIRLKRKPLSDDPIHLIGVAELHFWHGFDRLIRGMHRYYEMTGSRRVIFDVVGRGSGQEFEKLKRLVDDLSLADCVLFHGNQSGKALDRLFDQAHIGIGSLARHRSQISMLKTLKNREYAARGIAFIYSENDPDFDNQPYVLKQKPDESEISIESILLFFDQLTIDSSAIRASIEPALSWNQQMKQVVDLLKKQMRVT